MEYEVKKQLLEKIEGAIDLHRVIHIQRSLTMQEMVERDALSVWLLEARDILHNSFNHSN
jgi:hypothetical protein